MSNTAASSEKLVIQSQIFLWFSHRFRCDAVKFCCDSVTKFVVNQGQILLRFGHKFSCDSVTNSVLIQSQSLLIQPQVLLWFSHKLCCDYVTKIVVSQSQLLLRFIHKFCCDSVTNSVLIQSQMLLWLSHKSCWFSHKFRCRNINIQCMSLRRADRSSREALLSVVCLTIIVKPRQWGGPGPLEAIMPGKKK
jgi:hypothetical protein